MTHNPKLYHEAKEMRENSAFLDTRKHEIDCRRVERLLLEFKLAQYHEQNRRGGENG
jgi:hypothetical protein